MKKRKFKAEMSQLMDLVINSLYQNRDVFLRELISNAADACERLRFLAISEPKLAAGQEELRIRISIDKEAKTITIEDNGVGMDEQDVIDNLGQVASSGTRRFLDELRQKNEGGAGKEGEGDAFEQYIGKFGVGFYAAFLVADRVEVTTRKAGDSADKGVVFTTDGRSDYTIDQAIRPSSGTEVVLHIKEDCADYLEVFHLEQLARKYSGHISFPLHLPATAGAVVASAAQEGEAKDDFQIINPSPALWLRPSKDITGNEYKELYRHLGQSLDDPLSWLHCQLEGAAEYKALLYVPEMAPAQLFREDFHGRVKLYIRRVFVSLEHKLLPDWLRFLVGVIEAPHLAMNISREALQHDKSIGLIRKSLTKKVIDHFAKLAKNDAKTWERVYEKYSIAIKQGAIIELDHREALTALLRFNTTRGDEPTTLEDYVKRAPAEQKSVYYITAPDLPTAKASPYLEAMRKANVEVLLCTDPVDEWLIAHLGDFRERPFKAVHKGEFSLDEATGAAAKGDAKDEGKDKAEGDGEGKDEKAGDNAELLTRIRRTLEKRVKEVRATERLHESPACLVSAGGDLSLHTKEALRQFGHEVNPALPDMEINTGHPLIQGLAKTSDDAEFTRLVEVLYDVCALSAIGRLDNPVESARRITSLLSDRMQ